MLGNQDLTIPKRTVFGALALLLALVLVDHFTGIFTRLHLHNEEVMALQHGIGTPLYKNMLAELIDDTKAAEQWERRLAAAELGHLGAGAAAAEPALEALLDDEVPGVRAEAAIALARIGNHSARAVAALIDILQNASDHDRFLAINALALIGPAASAAIPALQAAASTGHPDVRTAARQALIKIGDTDEL